MKPLRLLVVGATGRMGARVISLAHADPHFILVGAVTEAGHASIGRDAAAPGDAATGVTVSDHFDDECDLAIEFSTSAVCAHWVRRCGERRVPIVSGTTGLDDGQRATLAEAARQTAVFWAPNMSIGANLLLRVAAEMAATLGDDVEIEICETHHSAKIDAPSGTARALLATVCEALGRDPRQVAVYGRNGQCGPRKPNEIGVHSLRIGDVIGEHEVQFLTGHETLKLRHEAHSRDAFAGGALRAARWLVAQPTGLYGMSDLLRIRS